MLGLYHACFVSRMVALTAGFESLMDYKDDSDSSECSEGSTETTESATDRHPDFSTVVEVLDKLYYSLRQMSKKNLTPFNVEPLTILLHQVSTLAHKSGFR